MKVNETEHNSNVCQLLLICELIYSIYQFQQGCPCWSLGQEHNFLCTSDNLTESTQTPCPCQCTTERSAVMSACRTPSGPECNITTSTLAFDQHFTTTAKGLLLLAEIVSVEWIWSVWLENILRCHHHNWADDKRLLLEQLIWHLMWGSDNNCNVYESHYHKYVFTWLREMTWCV